MLRKLMFCLIAALAVMGGYGCGGGAEEEPAPIEYNPSLDDALRKEQQGIPLSGKEKRILEDAREEGVIQ